LTFIAYYFIATYTTEMPKLKIPIYMVKPDKQGQSDSLYLVIESLQCKKHRKSRLFVIVGSSHSLFRRLHYCIHPLVFLQFLPQSLISHSSSVYPSLIFGFILSSVNWKQWKFISFRYSFIYLFFFSMSFHCYKLLCRCSFDYFFIMSLLRFSLNSM